VPFAALEATGADYELRVLNRYAGDFDARPYVAVNPKGRVPALVLDGELITENPIIQIVLARRFPDARLLPTDAHGVTTEAMSLLAWFASELHPAAARHRLPWIAFDGDRISDPEFRPMLQSVKLKARAALEHGFGLLEARLLDREWLLREFSTLDVYMLWLWFRAVGSGMDRDPFPRCADLAERTQAVPAVATVLDQEERYFAGYEADGVVPDSLPPFQVGRVPSMAAVRETCS
jgi:glutathione S-transferase